MKINVFSKAGIIILGILAFLWLSGCAGHRAEKIEKSSLSISETVRSTANKSFAVSTSAPAAAPLPVLATGGPNVDWWFVFKFNAEDFKECWGATRNCITGGNVQIDDHNYNGTNATLYRFGQQYVYASSENATLQKGSGCLGDTLYDPVGATFNQIYNSDNPYYYVIWNDQFYQEPAINGCPNANACFAPWGHSKGMVAWNDAGDGLVMQVSTPSWPASGNKAFPRQGGDGNTLGCVFDDNVYLSQHFFALKINKNDLVNILLALQNASVVTDPANKQIVNNGGPEDVQALVNSLGQLNVNLRATKVTLSTGVQLISKSSGYAVPPWQMVSAKMNGLPLLVASWYGEPNPIPSTEPMTPGCWAPDLGNPGPVAITTFGHWEIYPFRLDEYYNHAKFGASTDLSQPYAIFGDLNQQGALYPTANVPCSASQNGRGGTFYVVNDPTLQTSILSLITALPAKAAAP